MSVGDNGKTIEASAPRRTVAWFFWRIFRLPAIAFLLICVLMMFLETGMVYPIPSVQPEGETLFDEQSEEVFFESADGTKLQGRYYSFENGSFENGAFENGAFENGPFEGGQIVVLYCLANGEDVARCDPYMSFLRDTLSASVFCFNYRGYGKSEGRPNERGVIEDGLAAQRWLAEKAGLETTDIVIYGRSLGGGVAVAITAKQGAAALVLHGTFSNLPDVAASHFPWLPVRWLMRNRYPSVKRIKNFHGPIIQFHGTDDEVIPFALGRQLFDAAASEKKTFVEIPGGTHNEPLPKESFQMLREFLNSLPTVE